MEASKKPEPILVTLEANFHNVRDLGFSGKLVKLTKGGIMWGVHLKKEQVLGIATVKVTGSLFCFGPIDEQNKDWFMKFDHAFTISCKQVECVAPIKKSSVFNSRNNAISTDEWGDRKTPIPENWGMDDSVKLSCHLYITNFAGINHNLLKNRQDADADAVQEVNVETTLTPTQIHEQVMQCFTEMLVEEDIECSQETFIATEHIAQFFCYPSVLDICRKHLMRSQFKRKYGFGCIDDDCSRQTMRYDLSGFDYPRNTEDLRQRMSYLTEDDVVTIFQHLCLLAFRKSS